MCIHNNMDNETLKTKEGREALTAPLFFLREINKGLYENKTFGGFNHEDIIEGCCLRG